MGRISHQTVSIRFQLICHHTLETVLTVHTSLQFHAIVKKQGVVNFHALVETAKHLQRLTNFQSIDCRGFTPRSLL
jgi:hypothetical protein